MKRKEKAESEVSGGAQKAGSGRDWAFQMVREINEGRRKIPTAPILDQIGDTIASQKDGEEE